MWPKASWYAPPHDASLSQDDIWLPIRTALVLQFQIPWVRRACVGEIERWMYVFADHGCNTLQTVRCLQAACSPDKYSMCTGRTYMGVASSSNGAKLVAVSYTPNSIAMSADSGKTWKNTTSDVSAVYWQAAASSNDGTKIVAVGLSDTRYLFPGEEKIGKQPLHGRWVVIAKSNLLRVRKILQ